MSSDTTLDSPRTPSCSAVSLPQIDLSRLLTSVVGNFSLTFMKDGEYHTIGKLNPYRNTQLNDSRPCTPINLRFNELQDSCDSSYLGEPSPLDSSPGNINLISNYSEEGALSLINHGISLRQPSCDANGEGREQYQSDLVRQFSDKSTPQQNVSENQYTNNECSSRTIQIIRDYFVSLKVPFNEELECDMRGLRDLLWSVHHMSLKCLVSELINSLYPMRRKLHPYSQGTPISGWPEGVRYRDPAHIGVPERLALALWIYINPMHHPLRIATAHRKIQAKHNIDQLGLIYNVAMNIRQTLWQEQ